MKGENENVNNLKMVYWDGFQNRSDNFSQNI